MPRAIPKVPTPTERRVLWLRLEAQLGRQSPPPPLLIVRAAIERAAERQYRRALGKYAVDLKPEESC